MVRIQLEDGYLNVKEGTVFPLNLGVADVRDVSKRSGVFSKSITLVGDDNNNQLLNHYYDVNIVSGTFDINALTKCAVIENGLPILEDCYLQLISVNKFQAANGYEEYVEYTVVIKDAQADFFTKLDNKELTEIDLTDLNHTYSASNVVATFTNDYTDGYMYPLCFSPTNQLQLTDFKPAVYAKVYWDRIHATAGFSYSWSTMSDALFDKAVIPYNGDEPDLDYEDYLVEATKGSYTPTIGATITNWTEVQDDEALFNPTTGVYNSPFYIGTGQVLNAHVEVDIDINLINSTGANAYLRNTIGSVGTQGLKYEVRVQAWKGSQLAGGATLGSGTWLVADNPLPNGTTTIANVVAQGDIPINMALPTDDITFTFEVNVYALAGTVNVYKWYDAASGGSEVSIDYGLDSAIISNTITVSSNVLSFGQTLEMNDFIPRKVKQKDFIKSICTMYNLYVEPDKDNPNKLIYKHRDDYYDGGAVKDWTNKLAKDREQDLQFLPDLSAKKLKLTYKQDSDSYNQNYELATNEVYGQVEFTFDNEYVKDVDIKEIIFSPTPTAWNSFGAVVPLIIGAAPKVNIRILLHNGTKTCGSYDVYDYQTTGQTGLTSYPMVSHFDDHFNPSFDINFGVCDYYYYSPIFELTNNNLFNLYWRRTISQINTGKMLIAYFDLSEGDIQALSLSDKIRIDNSWWNINRVIDYDANSQSLTKVELLSVDEEIDLPEFRRRPKIVTPPIKGGHISDLESAYYRVNNANYSGSSVEVKGVGNVVESGRRGYVVGDNLVITQDGVTQELPSNETLTQAVVNIGNWNMDSTATISVQMPTLCENIRSIQALIINDAGTTIQDLLEGGNITLNVGFQQVDLNRTTAGSYDNTAYDDATINRGYVTIHYIS